MAAGPGQAFGPGITQRGLRADELRREMHDAVHAGHALAGSDRDDGVEAAAVPRLGHGGDDIASHFDVLVVVQVLILGMAAPSPRGRRGSGARGARLLRVSGCSRPGDPWGLAWSRIQPWRL